jgi:hypothetical protein
MDLIKGKFKKMAESILKSSKFLHASCFRYICHTCTSLDVLFPVWQLLMRPCNQPGEGPINAATKGMGGAGAFGFKNLIERPEKSWRPVAVILLAQVGVSGRSKQGSLE